MAGRIAAKGQGQERRIRARNQAAILAAAMAVFAQKGFDGTSIAAIAARSGLPKANVYYYFKSKDVLYATILGNLIAKWDAALGELRADRDPAEAIGAYVRAKLDFSRRHPAQSKMFANEVVHGGRFLSRRDRAHIQAATRERAAVLEQWAKEGRMDPVHPIHFFILLWSATQFYADFDVVAANALDRRKLKPADFEEAAETITRIVLKGCGIAG